MATKITFTPYLKKKNPDDTFGIINIRVTKERTSKYFSIGKSITDRLWNEKLKQVRQSHADYEQLNELIEDKITELKRQNQITGNVIQNKKSFKSYLTQYIQTLNDTYKFGTANKYKTTFYHLNKFLTIKQKTDLLFSDMNIDFVREFEIYLTKLKTDGGAGNRINTAKSYIDCIHKLYKQAVDSDICVMTKNPFTFYKNNKSVVEKQLLSKVDIYKIIDTRFDRSHHLYNTRNYFLFQYFAQGLRVRDLMTLRYSNILDGKGNIKLTQTKTRKSHFVFLNQYLCIILKDYIPQNLVDSTLLGQYTDSVTELNNLNRNSETYTQARKALLENIYLNLTLIIRNYAERHPNEFLLPILSNELYADVVFDKNLRLSKHQNSVIGHKIHFYNWSLKKLQTACNISIKLTSHLSRHSFANNLLKTGADIYDVSKLLGHANLVTTENYIKQFDKARVYESNQKFLEGYTDFHSML